MKKTRIGIAALIVAALSSLVGCAPSGITSTESHQHLAVTDVWVRAVPDLTEGNMTGVFMTVENSSDEDLYLTGGADTSGITSMPLEAHEVVPDNNGDMIMQKTENGILVPAHGSVQLMPGGYHLMYMMMMKPIAVGDTITFTMNVSDGSVLDLSAIAMTLEGGVEEYVPHGGMND